MDYFNQESERLIYRRLTEEDIPSWIEFFVDNDRLHFMGIDTNANKEDIAEEWINAQMHRNETQGLGHLAVITKDEGVFIGLGGILPRDLTGQKEYEVSYSLKPKYWGQGYGTEIAKTMKAYGTGNIETNRFISIIEITNTPSANVAKKNGMKILFKTEFRGMKVHVFGVNK